MNNVNGPGLTPEQALEIHRRASVWATARVKRYRVGRGELAPVTKAQAQRRCDAAEMSFVEYLMAIVPKPGAEEPTQHGQQAADARSAWVSLVEATR